VYLSVENITFKSHGVKRNSTIAVQQTRHLVKHLSIHRYFSVSISDDETVL